jgi:hypothetical protein
VLNTVTSSYALSSALSGALLAVFEKGNVLGITRCRTRRFGDALQAEEVLLGAMSNTCV